MSCCGFSVEGIFFPAFFLGNIVRKIDVSGKSNPHIAEPGGIVERQIASDRFVGFLSVSDLNRFLQKR